jgi:endonuclease YncB( thermonuclease family)
MKFIKLARRFRQILLFSIACLLLSFHPVFAQQLERQLRTVARVIDGDTIVLENGEKVRLIGVDTPETHHPQKPVESFGREASAFTRTLVEGQQVLVAIDPANTHIGHKDKYGRTLAYVWNERGKFVNAEIIEQGYGHALTQYPFKYLSEFRALEVRAKQQGNGLWQGNPEALPYSQTDRYIQAAAESAPITHVRPVPSNPSQDSRFKTSRSGSYEIGPIVDYTATGKPIYEGPRGGHYHITSGGNKSYHSGSASSRSSGGSRAR